MKTLRLLLVFMLLMSLVSGGTGEESVYVKEELHGNCETYYAMSDGTWKCGDFSYKYCLKISGRMPNAAVDSTFVYLSNREEITFEQAWKAAGLSSSMDDYFSLEEAALVDFR